MVIKCPQCFGTGCELSVKEQLEFVRKQREEEDKKKGEQEREAISFYYLPMLLYVYI
jgi:hypothetical protein